MDNPTLWIFLALILLPSVWLVVVGFRKQRSKIAAGEDMTVWHRQRAMIWVVAAVVTVVSFALLTGKL